MAANSVVKRFNKKKFVEDVKANVKKQYRRDISEATQQQIYQAVSAVIEA